MKSPFPGMDPFIEACGLWEGFHGRLIHRIDDALAEKLPDGYTIDTAVRRYVVLLDDEGKDEHLAKADVTITEPAKGKKSRRKKGGVAVVEDEESVAMQAFVAETFEETFIEIYAEGEERILVTCIELLSPSNKRRGGEGWQVYERKRQAMLLGRANFIEIDLLRGGGRLPMRTPWPESPYAILVSRASRAPYCRAWAAHFQRRLPEIPVPLMPPDPDLKLDLQPLIEGIYSRGRYHERIDYTSDLTPAPSDAEAAWLRANLKGVPSRQPRRGRNGS